MNKNRRTFRSNSQTFHKIHNYIVGDEIAKGSFSSIREAFHHLSWSAYAMKMISKKKLFTCISASEMIFSDSIITPLLQHPHIARVFQTIETLGSFFHVMPLYTDGDLLSFISHSNSSEEHLLSILDQILSAIEYLHVNFLCHRDLKPENILLTKSKKAKLTDFGFTTFSFDDLNSGKCGSYGYAAPELFTSKKYDGRKADIWSIGVLAYTIFSKKCPFPDKNDSPHVYMDLIDYSLVPSKIIPFIKDCLQINPNNRPNITRLRSYNCFRDIKRAPFYQQEFDYNSQILNPFSQIISRISELLNTSSIEIHNSLLENQPNRTKVLYFLLESHFNEVLTEFPQNNLCISSYSNEDPFLNKFNNKNINLKSIEYLGENGYKVSEAINNLLLSQKYCVSTSPLGTKTLVLNTEGEDIRFVLSLEDIPGEKKCQVVFNAPLEADLYIKQISNELKNKFPIYI